MPDIYPNPNTPKPLNDILKGLGAPPTEDLTALETLLISAMKNTSLKRIWPRSGTFYAIGDSQTAGYNGASKPYTSGGFLLDAFKWVNQAAAFAQLTSDNKGVGGSRISWNTDTTGGWTHNQQSHFNQMGLIPHNWSGVVAMMPGWNNISQGGQTTWESDYALRFQNSIEALIARGLITEWGGITEFGWTRQVNNAGGASSIPGWSVSGTLTNEDSSGLNGGLGIYLPFSYPSAGARYRIAMGASATITFQINNVRACALFFETNPSGGTFEVRVNGVLQGTFNTLFAPAISDVFPMVVWLDNIPAAATILITRTSGTVHFLAFGTAAIDTLSSRLLLVSSTTGNPANGRNSDLLSGAFAAAKAAVGAFTQNYPVLFVDAQTNWDTARDQEATDISHLTDLGNAQLATQFMNAHQPESVTSANFIRV